MRCGGCAGQHMVWCGVVVLVSSSRCDACGEMYAVVATRCEVDAVMIYTGDWIVVAADNTVCRQSSWWRNGCLRRMALAFSLCSTRLRDCWEGLAVRMFQKSQNKDMYVDIFQGL